MSRVMLVDDHQLVREAVARALDGEPDLEVVAQAGSLAEGVALFGRVDVDVVVVDVTLPDGNGLELVRVARPSSNTLGIVVLTMHADDDTLLNALDTATLDAVVDAVRRSITNPDVFSAAGVAAALRRRTAGDQVRLTPRETEVLEMLRDGLSVSQVARKLFMSESTVKTHIAKVYDKLGASNRAQALMRAIRQGIISAG
jgi:DNA-binding NarL/FixJ family response regulator